jgi:hypothetical protein
VPIRSVVFAHAGHGDYSSQYFLQIIFCDNSSLFRDAILATAFVADRKAPRALLIVEDLSRAPNGKLDYKALLKLATGRELAV